MNSSLAKAVAAKCILDEYYITYRQYKLSPERHAVTMRKPTISRNNPSLPKTLSNRSDDGGDDDLLQYVVPSSMLCTESHTVRVTGLAPEMVVDDARS